ncbi:MAG: hypothetical protein GEU89_21450 [Kiloniellaceae bacterium]|nr:hypothetical protein [Kiloniellaceae bacterium]
MWIELIVAVCLHSAPMDCREMHFQFVEARSLNGCMYRAQPYIARWSASHPNWKIVRWKCDYGKANEERI